MNKKDKSTIFVFIIFIVCGLFLGFGGWMLERWVNWKFFYGPKIEERISFLEKRVEKLEQNNK